MPSQPLPKKMRLTLAQLTSYDDILTDALVDKVRFLDPIPNPPSHTIQTYFWTTIRKNKSAYHPCRGIREEDVTNIIQKSVIVEEDAARAASQLLALSGLKNFSDALKSEKEKDDFRKHLRRYVNIYLPECPFEVSSTNRYTVVTHEAAVTARRFIKKGEVVKYLCGIQVIMTEEEEESIKTTRRDFSIVISSRNRSASLFLGPARFANHDCGANARLQTAGKDGMEIYAIRDIDVGDEITVSYGIFALTPFLLSRLISTGENYFGEDNCECLCKTCEDLCQNGWTAGENSGQGTPKVSIEEPEGYSFRRRRLESSPSSRDQSATPDVNIRPKVSKTPRSLSRFKNAEESPLGKSPSVEPSLTPHRLKREFDFLSPSPAPMQTKKVPLVKQEEAEAAFALPTIETAIESPTTSITESEAPSPAASSNNEATATDATSVDEDTIIVRPLPNPTVSKLRPSRKATIPSPIEQANAGATILVGQSTSITHPVLQDDNASVLSDLPSELELDEASMSITIKSPSNKRKRSDDEESSLVIPKPSTKKRARRLPSPKTDIDHAPSVRVPGDYVLTPALLAEPASSWIVCKNCEDPFVQKDSYFTRSSCPRCERHSKLYGYMWPKTENEGENDEERVLDHRTIHRFIKPDEERQARKRGRESVSGAETREISVVAVQEVKGRGLRKRGREDVGGEGRRGKRVKKESTAGAEEEERPGKKAKKAVDDAVTPREQLRRAKRAREVEEAATRVEQEES